MSSSRARWPIRRFRLGDEPCDDRYLGKDAFIRSKQAVGGPKDPADIAHLKR
jgi:hypothetical protein